MNIDKNRKIEILAPAGSYESLIAAVQSGCDAVYIGGNRFGARAYANNLTKEELLKAIDYVHLYKKQLYLTINTLLKEEELEQELYEYLYPLYKHGLDAVIVQDIGVMSFIHRYFPDIPIHASTQMTLTSADGVKVFEELGVTRLVTARELSLEEIQKISSQTKLEIESFVHGALCYCYSGQCLMSSFIGGRSGNRGRCAQPCRMLYESKDARKKEYLLSPKDLCTLEMIPELISCGIDSFKIEGRMKRAEYTALTVATYRKYVDLYLQLGEVEYQTYIKNHSSEFEMDVQNLMDIYNRGGFTNGYYKHRNGSEMMATKRPNHSGVKVGYVVDIKGNQASIFLEKEIYRQDILEFRNKKEENVYDYTVKEQANQGEVIKANFKKGSLIRKGDFIYRTKNQTLLSQIQENYLSDVRKIKIQGKFVGKKEKPMLLYLETEDIKIKVEGEVVQKAKKQPITVEKIKQQLEKTNTTLFQFEQIEFDVEENVFIPVGQLNEFRRMALKQLEEAIVKPYYRADIEKDIQVEKNNWLEQDIQIEQNNQIQENHQAEQDIQIEQNNQIQKNNQVEQNTQIETKLEEIIVSVSTIEQLNRALSYKEVDSIYLRAEDFTKKQLESGIKDIYRKGKKPYLILPSIFRFEAKNYFMDWIEHITDKTIFLYLQGMVLKNFEEVTFWEELKKKISVNGNHKLEAILDYNMYIVNREAKRFWNTKKITRFTTSLELNEQELKKLECRDSELIVYGYIPVMTSAQCVMKYTKGCKKSKEILTIKNQYQNDFYIKNCCEYCYNVIYNGKPISLLEQREAIKSLQVAGIRLEFTLENVTEMSEILNVFIQKFRYNTCKKMLSQEKFTKGHFKRGME